MNKIYLKLLTLLLAVFAFANIQAQTCASPTALVSGVQLVGESTTGNPVLNNNVCNGNYDSQTASIYSYTTGATAEDITVDVNVVTGSWSGVTIVSGTCDDPGATCLAFTDQQNNGNPYAATALAVPAATTIYVYISTWPTPNDVPNYDIELTASPAAPTLPGSVCGTPLVVGSIPYMDAGMTTAGFGDNVNTSPCAGNYITGDEKIYTYTPAANETVDVKLENLTDSWTGINITDACPDAAGAVCIGTAGSAGATTDVEVLNVALVGGFTYYFTISTNAAPQTTGGDFSIALSPTCSDPVNQVASNITATGAEFTWDNGAAGAATEWYVEYGTSGFVQGAGTTVTVMTFDSLLLTGLTDGTAYDWYVRSFCSAGDTSAWAGPNTFSTLNLPPATPNGVACVTGGANPTPFFYEDFEVDPPAGWTGDFTGVDAGDWDITPGNANSFGTGPSASFSGANHLEFEGSGAAITDVAIAVSPAIDLSAGLDDAELSFMMHAFGDNFGTFEVGIGNSVSGPFTNVFTFNGSLQTADTDDWVPVGISLSAYVGQTIFIELRNNSDGVDFESDMSIDSMVVMACATCIAPTAALTTDISQTTASFDWDGSGSPFGIWYVEYGPTGYTPGSGTVLPFGYSSPGPDGVGVGGGMDSAYVSGLTSATSYDWYVGNICNPGSPGDTSSLTGPNTFTTLADYCGADNYYDNGGAAGNYLVTAAPGTPETIFPDMPGDVVTATFNSFNTENGWDGLMIYDGPTTSDPLISSGSTFNRATCPNGAFTGTAGFAATGPYTSTHATGALTFVFTADGGVAAGWDATITCDVPPTCFQASSLMSNSVSLTTADVSWTPGASGTPHYIVEYGVSGFALGSGMTMVVATDTFATISGLMAETSYDFYVTDSCSVGDVGPTSAAGNFYTGYCLPIYGTTASSGCLDGDVIARVQLNTLDNNTGTSCPSGIAGYSNYADSTGTYTTTLNAGTSYDVTITAGPWTEGYSVWIDYNNDLVFDASENVGFTATTIAAGATETFPISLDCNPVPGNYRMRIRAMYFTNGGLIDPCNFQSNWGEVEDYTITIAPPPPCPQISNLISFDVTDMTAGITWDTGCAETMWDYEINTSATAPVGAPANVMYASDSIAATGLTPETVYYAHVRANCGADQSTWSTVMFTTLATPPANDDCANGIGLTVYGVGLSSGNELAQSTTGANHSALATTVCDGSAAPGNLDLFYTFTMPAGETSVNVLTAGATGANIEAAVYDVCGGTSLYCETQFGNAGSHIITGLMAGTSYVLQVWHDDFNAGDFDIALELLPPPPANDSINGAIVMTCGSTETVNTEFATSDATIGACGVGSGGTPGIGVWYSFIGTGEDIQVSLCASDFDTKLHIYSGAGAATCVDSNDDGALCGGLQSSITFTSVLGEQYYFLPGGFGTSTGNLEISVTCIPAGAITWLGGSTNYNDGTNWSGGVVPTCADDIFVPLTANNPTITGVFECNDFGTASSVNPLVSLAGSLGVCGNVNLANGTEISGTGVMVLIGTNTAGAGTFNVTGSASIANLSVQSNYAATGNVDINSGLIMNGGNFDGSGGTVTLKSTATGTAYLDDFTNTGSYVGDITVEQFITTGSGLGQRFFGSAVSGAPVSGLDGTYASGYPMGQVMVDVCDVSLAIGSPYSNLFEWHEDATFSTGCGQDGWFAIPQSTMLTPLRGYSGWVNDGSIISSTGTPTTGNVSYVTTGVSGNGPLNANGWHTLSNPYPSPINVSAFTNSGFTSPQLYNGASGPFNGTFTPAVLAGTISSMQGFQAESTGAGTVMATNADRVASSSVVWQNSATIFDQMLTIDVTGNGFADKTYVYFADDNGVTTGFDDYGDCKKRNSDFGQPTIYTTMGAEKMALHGNPTSAMGESIALGVDHGTDGNFELSFEGMTDFAANTTIYLEDKQTGVYHNVSTGNYAYSAMASDNADRFMLHFVLPVELATINVNCAGDLGKIELASTIGLLNRDYVIADATSTLSTGALTALDASVAAGTYTVTVNDEFGGNQVYTVEVEADEAIEALYTVSSLEVNVDEMISFNNTTLNATEVEWNIAGLTTINGVNNATYTFAEAGTYVIELMVGNGECADTKTFEVNVSNKTTSVSTVGKDNSIKVYSNEDVLMISFDNNFKANAMVEVQNVLGQKVFAGTVPATGTQTINVEDVTTGYYFVSVKVKGERLSKKVYLTKE